MSIAISHFLSHFSNINLESDCLLWENRAKMSKPIGMHSTVDIRGILL